MVDEIKEFKVEHVTDEGLPSVSSSLALRLIKEQISDTRDKWLLHSYRRCGCRPTVGPVGSGCKRLRKKNKDKLSHYEELFREVKEGLRRATGS